MERSEKKTWKTIRTMLPFLITVIFIFLVAALYWEIISRLYARLGPGLPLGAPEDTNPPQYFGNSTNSTAAGQPTLFSLNWTDDTGLSGYIFSTDNTGEWVNSSFISFTAMNTSWSVTTLNDTIGLTIGWRFYANDTSNNWNASEIFSLTTTDETPPTIDIQKPEDISYNYNESLPLNYTASDNVAVDKCWYSVDSGSNVSLVNCQNTTFDVSGDGLHDVSVYANDTNTNEGFNVVYFIVDTQAPKYSDNFTDNTIVGQITVFNLIWTDNIWLSGYIFSTNNSGTWSNSSWASFTGTENASWDVATLNDTAGALVQWMFYANDTGDNWNTSEIYDLITTPDTAPRYSNQNVNTTLAGQPCNFTLDWTDDVGLFGYTFSTNNTGTWENASFVPWGLTPISSTSWNVTILNSTSDTLVGWKFYAKDTSDNWNVSDTYEVYVVTTVPCELHEVNITPECGSDCGPGERIRVNATYSGDCPDYAHLDDPVYIQVNANSTDCYICDQDRDECEDDICNMTGITVSCSESPCSVRWTIPTVPAECQGETLNATYASLSSDFPCKTGSETKDEVTPTGSFTFYLTTTVPATTTSPGGGDGTTSVATTTVVTTTPTTTVSAWTTTPEYTPPPTMPATEETSSLTYWIIAVVVIAAGIGVFVWFKFFRTTGRDEFERLKEKWSRRHRR